MKRLAIIPARGGSKRIPGKNIKPFLGRPIIAYSIQAAIESGLFHEVMVSTDCPEIASIAKEYGARVPFMRSEKTADDFATTADVLREVIESYAALGETFDVACCIYATSPLISTERLLEGVDKMERGGFDSVFAMVRYSYPPQRALVERGGKVVMQNEQYALSRSQDLEPIYHDAGQFYFFGVDKFMATNKIWGDNTSAVILPDSEVQDIDTTEDWTLAELKYQMLYGR